LELTFKINDNQIKKRNDLLLKHLCSAIQIFVSICAARGKLQQDLLW